MLNPIIEFDRAFSLWVHTAARPWLDDSMKAITHGGDSLILLLVVLASGAFFWLRHRARREPLALLLGYTLSYTLDPLLKYFFQRARPELWDRLVARPSSFSFPSGHATSALVVYGLVALLLARSYPKQGWFFWLVAAGWTLLIGFSRIYLGVHWLTDVVGGFAIGIVLVCCVAALTLRSNRHTLK